MTGMKGEMRFDVWLETQDQAFDALKETLVALADAAQGLAARIARGALDGALGADLSDNASGDIQKALDVIADETFATALRTTPVRWYASEERDAVVEFDPHGVLAVAIDPLDGSSNIDVNVSIGAIFSVFPAEEDASASFLRPGHEQIAAGYVIYGPHTAMAITLGQGVAVFTLDQAARTFVKTATARVPSASGEYAINTSNRRHWPGAIRAYVDDCELGAEGPLGRDSNMRWIASLVAETHRILTRGGGFIYPQDSRPGYARGRLRAVYECAPIALLIEQAGGLATDGKERLLDKTPDSLHARTPFVFGSSETVRRIAAYHDLPQPSVAPLFGERGLFKG